MARAEDCGGRVTADEALAAEDARYAAQMGDDFGALQKLIGNDLVYIHSSAVVDSKASYIESMKSGTVKYRVMRRSDVRVRTYGCVSFWHDLTRLMSKRDRGLEFISWEATRTPQKQ